MRSGGSPLVSWDALSAEERYAREPCRDLTPEQRQQYMADYVAFQNGPVWGGWRQAEIKEIRELLENACK